MNDSNPAPCELPSPGTVLGWIGKRTVDLLVVAVLAFLLGEVYLRSYLGYQHDSGPDPDLGRRIKPNQDAYLGRINSDGHRGQETDWDRPMVVVVGDSQAFGHGMADDEVWTSHLSRLLNESSASEPIQVVNAAHPAAGPYHQLVELRRVLARQPRHLRAILVRVDIEDRYFVAPLGGKLKELQAETQKREELRAWTRFLPYLTSRLSQQKPALASLIKWSSPAKVRPIAPAVGEAMWGSEGAYWREMIALAGQIQVPLIFFVHDPTDLPSSEVLCRRLNEAGAGRAVRVIRMASRVWGAASGPVGPVVGPESRAIHAAARLPREPLASSSHGPGTEPFVEGRAFAAVC